MLSREKCIGSVVQRMGQKGAFTSTLVLHRSVDTELTAALCADAVRERQINEGIPASRRETPEDLAGAVVFPVSLHFAPILSSRSSH